MAESRSAIEAFEEALLKARALETPRYKIVGCRVSGQFLKELSDEAKRCTLLEGDLDTASVQLRRLCDVTLYIGLVEKLDFDFGYV